MAIPLLKRRRVLAAKVESTIGTAEALAAGDGAFNVFDPMIQPDIPYVERPGASAFSPQPGVPGARMGRCTFSTYMECNGSAVPAWASTFLPACGWYDGGLDTYKPDSLPPGAAGANLKTLTIGCHQDGVLKEIAGAMGTFKIICTNGEPVRIDWEFIGKWIAPTDVALVAPTYPNIDVQVFRASTLTIGGAAPPPTRELTIDAGNVLSMREDATDASGYHSAVIAGRRVIGTLDPEADLVANFNAWNTLVARTEAALVLNFAEVNIAAPKLQYTEVTEADRNEVETDAIGFQLNRSAAAGDDELTFNFTP